MNPTPMLRFVERQVPADFDTEGYVHTMKTVRILQQWWSRHLPYGINGPESVLYDARVAYNKDMGEWRDVPLEKEAV